MLLLLTLLILVGYDLQGRCLTRRGGRRINLPRRSGLRLSLLNRLHVTLLLRLGCCGLRILLLRRGLRLHRITLRGLSAFAGYTHKVIVPLLCGTKVFVRFRRGFLSIFFLQGLLLSFLFRHPLLSSNHGLLGLLKLLSRCLLLGCEFRGFLTGHCSLIRLALSVLHRGVAPIGKMRLTCLLSRLLLIICVLALRLLSLLLVLLRLLVLLGLLCVLLLRLLLRLLLLLIGLYLLLVGLLLLVSQGLLLGCGLRMICLMMGTLLSMLLGTHPSVFLGRSVSGSLGLRLLLVLGIGLLLLILWGRLLIARVTLRGTGHTRSRVTARRVVHGTLPRCSLRGCGVAVRIRWIVTRDRNGTSVVTGNRVIAALTLQIVEIIIPVGVVSLRLLALKASRRGLDKRRRVASRFCGPLSRSRRDHEQHAQRTACKQQPCFSHAHSPFGKTTPATGSRTIRPCIHLH